MEGINPTSGVISISNLVVKFVIVMAVLSLLPESPFVAYVSLVERIPYLGYLAWFVPIGDILIFFGIYLSTVTVYYGILLALRYANLVKGG